MYRCWCMNVQLQGEGKNNCYTSTNQTLKYSQMLLLNDNHKVLIYYIHPFSLKATQCIPHVSSPFTPVKWPLYLFLMLFLLATLGQCQWVCARSFKYHCCWVETMQPRKDREYLLWLYSWFFYSISVKAVFNVLSQI